MDIVRIAVVALSWAFFGFAIVFLLFALATGQWLLPIVLAVIGGVLQGVHRLIRRR